jgi:pimeloyl-ACP methyl ester carboxylesterase
VSLRRTQFTVTKATGRYGLTNEIDITWEPRIPVPNAPIVVLLHGVLGTADYFQDVASQASLPKLLLMGPLLASYGSKVIAIDGGSRTAPQGPDNALLHCGNPSHTARIETLRTSLGASKLSFVGISMGNYAALQYVVNHPTNIGALVSYSGVCDLPAFYDAGVTNGLSLPGTNGSYASTPDNAALDITGDIDLRAEITATDWTPSANRSIVSKYVTTGNQRSYRLRILTTGRLELVWTTNGSTQGVAASTVNPTVTDGGRLAVRATLDVDNGASGRTTTFYTASTIAGPWTQLGTPVTTAGITSIFSGTAPLEVGSVATGIEPFQGSIYKVEVRNGINGTVVANPDFSAENPGTTSFSDATGKTWTLNGSAAIVSGRPTYISDAWSVANGADLPAAADIANHANLVGIPWMGFHDTDDSVVAVATAQAMAAHIGSSARLTIFPTGDHVGTIQQADFEDVVSWIWDYGS